MDCRLCGDKPWSEPIMLWSEPIIFSQLEPQNTFYWNINKNTN